MTSHNERNHSRSISLINWQTHRIVKDLRLIESEQCILAQSELIALNLSENHLDSLASSLFKAEFLFF